MPHRWEDVRMTIIRPGPVDQRGACANSIPQDDLKAFSLPSGKITTLCPILDHFCKGVMKERLKVSTLVIALLT